MSDGDTQRGLYGKYLVKRIVIVGNGDQFIADPPGPVFVLAYAGDPHARVALAAYIESCQEEYPLLAEDLREQLRKTQ